MKNIQELRAQIDNINREILDLLGRRAELAEEIGAIKGSKGLALFDPTRESEMLSDLLEKNSSPLTDDAVKGIFKEIFRSSLDMMERDRKEKLLVSRQARPRDTVITVGDVVIGAGEPVFIAGPCAVESTEQLEAIARFVSSMGIRLMRAGIYKPRTSPYSFQGLREKGLDVVRDTARRHNLLIVSEILDPRHFDQLYDVVDIFQVGTRNMQNYELLNLLGEADKPVLLKRGFMATLEEFLMAAEYVAVKGNDRIILCERGIRTFERWTRNTLDISAVPLLKQETHLPVIVDISHSVGRKDIAVPIARAAIAAGADGVMVEVHGTPDFAFSDADQQLGFDELRALLGAVGGPPGAGPSSKK